MPLPKPSSRHALSVVLLAGLFAAGCGGQTTDISAAVDDTNKTLDGAATLSCPKEIDGGEGTKFDCKLKGKAGETATVNLKVGKDSIAPVSEKEYVSALGKVTGG